MSAAGIRQPGRCRQDAGSSLEHPAATDWASLGTHSRGEMLAYLQRAQAKLTAVNAAVLAAFTAHAGTNQTCTGPQGPWLINRAGMRDSY